MPVKEVKITPGCIYHIYNKAVSGSQLYPEDNNFRYFISKIELYLPQACDILAYCLMPTHYHLLVKIQSRDFSTAMQKLALSYAVSFNRYFKRTGRLFSAPYQRKLITDMGYLLQLSRYIHLNPVKSGLVSSAQEWIYSSCRDYYGIVDQGFLTTRLILDLMSDIFYSSLKDQRRAYRNYLESGELSR